MREVLKLVNRIIAGVTLISIAAAAGIWGYLALLAYLDARKVAGTAQKPIVTAIEKADCVIIAATGKEEVNPDLTPEELKVLAIAAGVAIDREGENSDCFELTEDTLIDAYVRMNERYKNRPSTELTTKSIIWLPNKWTQPWLWRDRPICLIRGGREETIKRLKPIVERRLKSGVAPGCADKLLRPGFHLGGWIGDETKARAEVSKYPVDQAWEKKRGQRVCNASFRCSP
jgi:hypothetical protein